MTKQNASLLIVDDDVDVLLAAKIVLKKHFESVDTEASPEALQERLNSHSYDVLLLDMNFQRGATSGKEGLEWLALVQEVSPNTKVILMTAYGGVDLAIRAMRGGAVDFIIKPWDNAKLVATVSSACRYSQASQEVSQLKAKQGLIDQDIQREFSDIVGESDSMRDVLATIKKVAATDANVLILGESGTGKELVARALHNLSLRNRESFIGVDLGAVPDSLFESELFGHAKGSFTDAKTDRAGRFELANRGTLFLDEVGNLSLQGQAKLLGALETRTITRVGSNRPIKLNIRVICATSLLLDEKVESYEFRQDLFYRINTVEIRLPALRERASDIPLLVEHYRQQFSKKYHKNIQSVGKFALQKLQEYTWPGNVRELKHAIERAVIMSDGRELSTDDFVLPKPINKSQTTLNLGELEKDAVSRALVKYQGNISQAAEALGLGRATLYRKMAKYGLS